MSKSSGGTRTVSASNAAASRTVAMSAASANGGANNKELPKGWSLNPYKKNSYDTNVEISSQAMYGLREIYGESFTTGHSTKGTTINTSSLELAKSIAQDGKILTDLIKSYNMMSEGSDSQKYYEKEIRTYIADAKKKQSK